MDLFRFFIAILEQVEQVYNLSPEVYYKTPEPYH